MSNLYIYLHPCFNSYCIIPLTKKTKGHRVFCCCDSRKATIMVSLVALVLNILALIGRATVKPVDGWGIAAYSISVLFYFLVIWGTIRYHRCAVIISLIWQIVAVVSVYRIHTMISYVCMYVISYVCTYVDGFTDMQYLTTLSIYHLFSPPTFCIRCLL